MDSISNLNATNHHVELRARADLIADRPIAYIPIGSTDGDSGHCPPGLTGAFAQSVCIAAAEFTGGAVLPTVTFDESYQTTIDGNSGRPDDLRLEESLSNEIISASSLGARQIILFSGSTEVRLLGLIRRVAVRHTTDWRCVDGLSPATPGDGATNQRPGQLATLLQPAFAPDGLSSFTNEPGSPVTDRADAPPQSNHVPAERLHLAAALLETIINTANKDTTT